VLSAIDDYYADINTRPEAVATQLVRQLADPRPRDAQVTSQLSSYKALDPHWTDGRLHHAGARALRPCAAAAACRSLSYTKTAPRSSRTVRAVAR
jgi:hypothetical protein